MQKRPVATVKDMQDLLHPWLEVSTHTVHSAAVAAKLLIHNVKLMQTVTQNCMFIFDKKIFKQLQCLKKI